MDSVKSIYFLFELQIRILEIKNPAHQDAGFEEKKLGRLTHFHAPRINPITVNDTTQ